MMSMISGKEKGNRKEGKGNPFFSSWLSDWITDVEFLLVAYIYKLLADLLYATYSHVYAMLLGLRFFIACLVCT